MPPAEFFAPDYAETPYWWRAAPPRRLEYDLPSRTDVLVVGAGFTGLSAALALASAGRQTVVIDAEDAGFGASTRNAGFVGKSLKHSLGETIRDLGEEQGIACYREAEAAYRTVFDLVEQESIDCHLVRGGRVIGAYSERQLKAQRADLDLKHRLLGEQFELLDAEAIQEELQTTMFVGGARIADSATIHPGLYHRGLLRAALTAGSEIVTGARLTQLDGDVGSFVAATSRGNIAARDVVVATNGYTSAGVPRWLRRRLVPFEGFMLATEELPASALDAIMPFDRSIVDGRTNLAFIRRAPDSRRILFGSRAGMGHGSDLRNVAAAVWADATMILPGLEQYRISHFWGGRCAGTFDLYPHVGKHDGVHYAVGYNFGGIAMGSHLGRRAARMLLSGEDDTAFANRRFPTLPLYNGHPWFLPLAMHFFDFQDRRAIGRRPL